MRIGLYAGSTLSDVNISNMFVLSGAISNLVVCGIVAARCMAQQTANA